MTRSFDTLFSDWGIAVDTSGLEPHVQELRVREERLRQQWHLLTPDERSAILWRMIAADVPEAEGWDGTTRPLAELCEQALKLRGGLNGGPKRLAMRERARILKHASNASQRDWRQPDDLLALWDEATRLEPAVRLRVASPRWREAADGLPFTGMSHAWLFGTHPLGAGQETADPADIPRLVELLLDFVSTEEGAPEVVAAHVPHLMGYVHPFVDGNGHTGRLLMCDLLARAGYGTATLIAHVDGHRAGAAEWSRLMRSVMLGRAEAQELLDFQLHLLLEAQAKVLESLEMGRLGNRTI